MPDPNFNWPIFRRVERRARRTQDMMERLDVDPLALVRLRQGEAYAEARQQCLMCGTSDKCLRWLEEEHTPDDVPEFCPNARIFVACRRQQKKQ